MNKSGDQPMFKVRATAPTRVDLAGGTIDLWPIHQVLKHKATVNCAVSLNAEVEITPSNDGAYHLISADQGQIVSGSLADCVATKALPLLGLLLDACWDERLPPITIRTSATSPAGAGLGGSSCLAVTTAAALKKAAKIIENNPQTDPLDSELVQIASDIEAQLIHAPTGVQDYWGAIRGGLNILEYPRGKVTVETFNDSIADRPNPIIGHLADELILCFSGKSRQSAINNWEIFKRVFDGDKALIARLEVIGVVAAACADAVRAGNYQAMIEASAEEWRLRCELWPNIHSEETAHLSAAATKSGATLARVCGAGGGGVLAVLAPTDVVADVRKALQKAGGQLLPARPAMQGLTSQYTSVAAN